MKLHLSDLIRLVLFDLSNNKCLLLLWHFWKQETLQLLEMGHRVTQCSSVVHCGVTMKLYDASGKATLFNHVRRICLKTSRKYLRHAARFQRRSLQRNAVRWRDIPLSSSGLGQRKGWGEEVPLLGLKASAPQHIQVPLFISCCINLFLSPPFTQLSG